MIYLLIFLKFILRFLEGFLAFAGMYFLCAFWLPFCAVNRDFVQPREGVEIFIESNGVHTDFLVPSRNKQIDWFSKFPGSDFQEADTTYNYVSIGWGDRGFYLYTPTWADLKFSTAFKAVFALDSAAMHVTYHRVSPSEDEWTRRLVISEDQYAKLIDYVLSGFKKKEGKLWHIQGHTYGTHDCFYEANGRYSLFKTCNVWTCQGLKSIGVKIGVWAPFEDGIRKRL
jgi:uncharacterized protein (TIGR02117 family)